MIESFVLGVRVGAGAERVFEDALEARITRVS
jgi:hypothetical protein